MHLDERKGVEKLLYALKDKTVIKITRPPFIDLDDKCTIS